MIARARPLPIDTSPAEALPDGAAEAAAAFLIGVAMREIEREADEADAKEGGPQS
jgi:hypothetical protein